MNKKIISIVLIFTMIASSISVVSATSKNNECKNISTELNVADLLNQVPTLGGVINNARETTNNFIYSADNTKISIPKEGSGYIKSTFDPEHGQIKMKLPDVVSTAEAKKTKNGTMVYNSKRGNTDVLVQMLEDEENDFVFSSVRTMVLIKDATAPKRYDFTFDLPKGARLITSEEYKQTYCQDNADWIGDSLIFVIDENGSIISTIDEAWAKDANSRDVETYYKINDNVLTQIVNFDASNDFPIIADPTNTGVKTKVETLAFSNTKANINKLVKARNDINNRQNSTLSTVISLINSVFGLFSVETGIMSMVISGVIGGNARFLEKCEDVYTTIEEGFLQKNYSDAEVYYKYRGTYQGKNKGYVYEIESVSSNRGK